MDSPLPPSPWVQSPWTPWATMGTEHSLLTTSNNSSVLAFQVCLTAHKEWSHNSLYSPQGFVYSLCTQFKSQNGTYVCIQITTYFGLPLCCLFRVYYSSSGTLGQQHSVSLSNHLLVIGRRLPNCYGVNHHFARNSGKSLMQWVENGNKYSK